MHNHKNNIIFVTKFTDMEKRVRNPFIMTGYVSDKYFCDRETESKRLIRLMSNGNNVVVISPRRMGKTGLIQHCFATRRFRSGYYTFLIDIFATSNLKELVYILGKNIFDTLSPRGKKIIDKFFSAITSLRPAFKLDIATGSPIFDIGINEITEPSFTLEEIFKYLESADKPCVVAIDEFQQIAKYPETNVEAVLRSHIQKCTNTTFIFAGSQRHLMENIFMSNTRPFYQSVSMVPLEAIPLKKYKIFVVNHFSENGKTISEENVETVYNLFDGHTWYVQSIFNSIYSMTETGETVSEQLIFDAIDEKLITFEATYQGILSFLSERQKEVLYAIAKEGKASELTSSIFVRKHGLISASSVQAALRQLLEREFVTIDDKKTYWVYDRFFGLWLAKTFGTGYNNILRQKKNE